jgi:hypothetical protein
MSEALDRIALVTTSFPDRRFWSYGGEGWKKELGSIYSIGIWNLEEDDYVVTPNIHPDQKNKEITAALYEFITPPSSYEIAEPAAITVVPLQDGGKYVESQGNLFKEIRVAGTVGLRPGPVSNQIIPGLEQATGISLEKPKFLNTFTKDERGLDPKEMTGFDQMTFLRNIFRFYFDLKGGSDASKYTLVWSANNEGEIWAVEPVSFIVTKSSDNPFVPNYNIQLKTLYKFDDARAFPFDTVSVFQAFSNLTQNIRKFGNDMYFHLNEIASNITALALLPGNIVNNMLSVGVDIVNGLAAVKNTVENFPEVLSRNTIKAFSDNLRAMSEAFDEADTSREDYDEDYLSPSSTEARNNLKWLQRIAESILSTDALWLTSTKQTDISEKTRAYASALGDNPFTTGSPLDPNNMVMPGSTTQKMINPNETIRSLAKRYMGNEAEWKKLAIMNNLKAPYISSSSSTGVLGPGDYIVVPSSPKPKDLSNQIGQQYNEDQKYLDLDPLRRKFGRDLKISQSSSSSRLGDLKVSQNGDLDFIDGKDNVEQAIRIKFSTERGELSVHPEFGNLFELGRKINLVRFQQYKMATRQTLLQDPRVESVKNLKVFSEGNIITVTATIKLLDSHTLLPFTYSIRR